MGFGGFIFNFHPPEMMDVITVMGSGRGEKNRIHRLESGGGDRTTLFNVVS